MYLINKYFKKQQFALFSSTMAIQQFLRNYAEGILNANVLKTSTPNHHVTGLVLLNQRVSGRTFSNDSYPLCLHCLPLLRTILEMFGYNCEKCISNQLFQWTVQQQWQRIYLTVKTWQIMNALILAKFSKLIHFHLFLKTFSGVSCIYFTSNMYSFATFMPLFSEEKCQVLSDQKSIFFFFF